MYNFILLPINYFIVYKINNCWFVSNNESGFGIRSHNLDLPNRLLFLSTSVFLSSFLWPFYRFYFSIFVFKMVIANTEFFCEILDHNIVGQKNYFYGSVDFQDEVMVLTCLDSIIQLPSSLYFNYAGLYAPSHKISYRSIRYVMRQNR